MVTWPPLGEDEFMIGSRNIFKLFGIGGLVLFGATACNASFVFDVEGSGVAETVTYDFESFDEVDIGSAFQADITIADGPPSVEITIDDNLVDKLDVRVDDGELKVDMDGGRITFEVEPTIVITMPELTELELSGAADGTVRELDADELKVDVSGASTADIRGTVRDLILEGSGGSEFRMDGSAARVDLDLSGAGSADFRDAPVGAAHVDLSGGSRADFDEIDEVAGDLSGASTIVVPEDADLAVSTSGASEIKRS